MKKVLMIVAAFAVMAGASAMSEARPVTPINVQSVNCPLVFPDGFAAVAPGQPPVETRSTVGVINALCDVTLNMVGCKFFPNSVSILCDSNGDGVSDVSIALKNVTIVNSLLVRATLSSLTPGLPGTAFPLTCCGGIADLVIARVHGEYVSSVTCPIDLGQRAPVVVSASPSDGNCSVEQNLIIPGSCFLLPNGNPNVTSVFAVERGNPNHIIQAKRFVILTTNLIDALFDFGVANAGKTFLIYASGPSGTSRNLIELPTGAPANCPLGNEQGVQVTFTCRSSSSGGGEVVVDPALPFINQCFIERNAAGTASLVITGLFKEGSKVTIGGTPVKKVKFKERDTTPGMMKKAILKKACDGLPGAIIVTQPDGLASSPFQCSVNCSPQ